MHRISHNLSLNRPIECDIPNLPPAPTPRTTRCICPRFTDNFSKKPNFARSSLREIAVGENDRTQSLAPLMESLMNVLISHGTEGIEPRNAFTDAEIDLRDS